MSYIVEPRIAGLLLGAAAGDSLGLPGERLCRKTWARRFPGPLHQRFLFGRGMISDDTELMIMTAQAVLASGGDEESFLLSFSWRLRYWLLLFPAGCGWATLRAGIRLWAGVSYRESGSASAGNGAAIRSAVFGALFPDPIERREFVRLGTRVTHSDPRAFLGALAVAEMAVLAINTPVGQKPGMEDLCSRLRNLNLKDEEWRDLICRMEDGWQKGVSVADFAISLGLQDGVTGYVYHTVPVALYGWYTHYGDIAATLNAVIPCGGDTDSTGAIAGALAGASAGAAAIPGEYLNRLLEYPYDVAYLRRLATQLARFSLGVPASAVPAAYPALLLRNLLFGGTVIGHLVIRAVLYCLGR